MTDDEIAAFAKDVADGGTYTDTIGGTCEDAVYEALLLMRDKFDGETIEVPSRASWCSINHVCPVHMGDYQPIVDARLGSGVFEIIVPAGTTGWVCLACGGGATRLVWGLR